jgi:hypothetical protein
MSLYCLCVIVIESVNGLNEQLYKRNERKIIYLENMFVECADFTFRLFLSNVVCCDEDVRLIILQFFRAFENGRNCWRSTAG